MVDIVNDKGPDHVLNLLGPHQAGKATPGLNLDSYQYQELSEAWKAACCGDVYKMDAITQTGDETVRYQHGATCLRAAVRVQRLIMPWNLAWSEGSTG